MVQLYRTFTFFAQRFSGRVLFSEEKRLGGLSRKEHDKEEIQERASQHQERLASEVWRLYLIDGTHWYRQKTDGAWRYVKKPLSVSDLEAHLMGDMTVGLPSAWKGRAKFVTIDVDTIEGDNLRRLATCLRDLEVPHLLSFSGNKGFHGDLFVKESQASEVARVGGLLKIFLSQQGVAFDEVLPSGTGLSGKTPGGANVKLPLGIHRRTGHLCHCLGEDLSPVSDPLRLLQSLRPVDVEDLSRTLAESLHLDVDSGELRETWERDYPHQLHHSKLCVNVLWQEGLQAPDTRHSATMVVAIAIASNWEIPEKEKKPALIDWIVRMYGSAMEKGYIDESTTLEFATGEALRLYEAEAARAYIGVTCINPPLRPAMKSACRDPVGCHLARTGGRVDFVLLTRVGIFNPSNCREPGIGRATGFVYLAHQAIAGEHAGKHFQYNGRDTYAAPLAMLGELSGCSQKTVKKGNRALIAIGLTVKVPREEVPKKFRKKPIGGQKFVLQARFYYLPDLTEDYVRDVVLPKTRAY